MLPDQIILDTRAIMQKFRALAAQNNELPEWVDDVVQRLVGCFATDEDPLYHLNMLVEMVRAGELDGGDNDVDDIPALYAEVMEALGVSIYLQLEAIGAFMPDGSLPYHIGRLGPREHPNDLVLTLTKRLNHHDTQSDYAKLLTSGT